MDIASIRIVILSLAAIAILSLGSITLLDALGRGTPASLVCALQVSIGCLAGILVPVRGALRGDDHARFEVKPPPPPTSKNGQ